MIENIDDLHAKLIGLGIKGINADSRLINKDDAFVAIKGEESNGLDYCDAALKNGAKAVIMSAHDRLKKPLPDDIAVFYHDNPRLALAKLAARFYGPMPDRLVAVTGTNGKSSVVEFTRQLWVFAGFSAASIGTLGIAKSTNKGIGTRHDVLDIKSNCQMTSGLTTMDSVALCKSLKDLHTQQIRIAAMEASSHGLAQYRLDGLRLLAGAITNITHDHLDYHGNFDNYKSAKYRLIDELLGAGSTAVINCELQDYASLKQRIHDKKLALIDYGFNKGALNIQNFKAHGQGFSVEMDIFDHHVKTDVPLLGRFQLENMLAAIGLALASGYPPAFIGNIVRNLKTAAGRMEVIGHSQKGAKIIVDYAHTPDALMTMLGDVRAHFKGNISLVFGCGGNRDRQKRPIMGGIAEKYADKIYVTDDNPRFEDAGQIRSEIMENCPSGLDIAGRDNAIHKAIESAGKNDVVILAGKGHERDQLVGNERYEFDDRQFVKDYINGQNLSML